MCSVTLLDKKKKIPNLLLKCGSNVNESIKSKNNNINLFPFLSLLIFLLSYDLL